MLFDKHTLWGTLLITAAILAQPACRKKEAEQEVKPAAATGKKAGRTETVIQRPARTSNPSKANAATTGKVVLGKLTGAQEVSVKELLTRPKDFVGKMVRLSGKVEDFCHHRRAWFGISAADGRGMVRVFTLPSFQVPQDCLGKKAVAEGKVELVTIPAKDVAHYNKDHKFLRGVKVEPGKDVVRPLIRATGAEFE